MSRGPSGCRQPTKERGVPGSGLSFKHLKNMNFSKSLGGRRIAPLPKWSLSGVAWRSIGGHGDRAGGSAGAC